MFHPEKEKVQKILIPRGTVSGDKDCILEIPWKFKYQPYVIARKPKKGINLSNAHVDRDLFSKLCCKSGSNHPGSGCFYDKTLNTSQPKDASTIFQSKTNVLKNKDTQLVESDSALVPNTTDREMMTPKIEDITINEPKIKIGSELVCRNKYPCKPPNNYQILDCLNFFPPEKTLKSNKCQSSSNDLLQELMELVCSIPSQRRSEPTVNMHIHLSKKVEKLLLPFVESEISNVSLDSESEECECLNRKYSDEDCQLDTYAKILSKMAMAKQNRTQLNYSLNQTHNSSLNKTPRTIFPRNNYHENTMLEVPHNNTWDQTQKIIIPKNTINSHENTVVEVPQNLQRRHVVVVQGGNYTIPETDQGQCTVQEHLVKKSCTPNCSQACTSYEHVNEITCTSEAGCCKDSPFGGCCSPKPVPTSRLPSYCEFCCPSRTCLYAKEHSCSVCEYPKLHCSYSRMSKLGCDFLKPSLNLDFENTNSLHKIKLMKKLEETEKMERQALEADLTCFQNARRRLILNSKDFTSNMSLNDCFLPYPEKSRIEIPCLIKPASKSSNWDKLLGDVKDLSKVLSNSLTNLIPGRSCSATAVRDTTNSNNTSDDEDQEITEVENALRDFQKARRKLMSMMQECSSAQNVSILKKSISKKP